MLPAAAGQRARLCCHLYVRANARTIGCCNVCAGSLAGGRLPAWAEGTLSSKVVMLLSIIIKQIMVVFVKASPLASVESGITAYQLRILIEFFLSRSAQVSAFDECPRMRARTHAGTHIDGSLYT